MTFTRASDRTCIRAPLVIGLLGTLFVGPSCALPPPCIVPHESRPLLVFQGPSAPGPLNSTTTAAATARLTIKAYSEQLPTALRPLSVIQVAARVTNDTQRMIVWRALLTPLQAAGVPVILQIADPGEEFTMPLALVEQLIAEFDAIVKGVELAEVRLQTYTQFGGDLTDTPSANARNFANAIVMAASHGKVVLGQLDFLRWTHLSADRTLQPLLEVMRQYHAYVIPINEMVAPNALSRHTSAMGLWLSDAVDSFGLEAQSWFWQNSGYLAPGVFGVMNTTWPVPSRWYGPMILLAAMTGAKVFSFEPFWDLWPGQGNSHVASEVIFPLLQRVVEQGLVASKADVLRRTRVAYQLDECATLGEFHRHVSNVDAVSAEGWLSRAAYGLWWRGMGYEVVPDRHAAFMVPLLPWDATEAVLARFDRVFHVDDADTEAGWAALLAQVLPPPSPANASTAFVATGGLGGRSFVMHTRENLYERQTYSLPAVRQWVATPTVELHDGAAAAAAHCNDTGDAGAVNATVRWAAVSGALSYKVHAAAAPPVPSTTTSGWQPPWDEFSFLPVAVIGGGQTAANVSLPCAPRPGPEGQHGAGGAPFASDVVVAVGVTAHGTNVPLVPLNGTVNRLGYHAFPANASALRFIAAPRADGSTLQWDLLAWPNDPRPVALQQAWPLFPGVPAAQLPVAREVASAWEGFVAAYQAADWHNATAFYSPAYCDPNGFGRNYVGRAFKWWLSRYATPFAYYQDRRWNVSGVRASPCGASGVDAGSRRVRKEGGHACLSAAEAGSVVTMCLYVQLRAVSVWDLPWDDHGLMRIPRDDAKEACITWRLETDRITRTPATPPHHTAAVGTGTAAAEPPLVWRVVSTSPALPNMEEMLWNARGYAEPHTLTPGVDAAFDVCVPVVDT